MATPFSAHTHTTPATWRKASETGDWGRCENQIVRRGKGAIVINADNIYGL